MSQIIRIIFIPLISLICLTTALSQSLAAPQEHLLCDLQDSRTIGSGVSKDGRHVYQVLENQGNQALLVDKKEVWRTQKGWEIGSVMLSDNGKSWACAVSFGNKFLMVVNGKEWGPYYTGSIVGFSLSKNGEHYSFAAINDLENLLGLLLIKDGIEKTLATVPPFWVSGQNRLKGIPLIYSNDGKNIAWVRPKNIPDVVTGSATIGGGKIVFPPISCEILIDDRVMAGFSTAYSKGPATASQDQFNFTSKPTKDGTALMPSTLTLSGDGKHVAYWARKEDGNEDETKNWYVYLDGNEKAGPFNGFPYMKSEFINYGPWVNFNGLSIGWFAGEADRRGWLYVGNQKFGPYSMLPAGFIFSKKGDRFAVYTYLDSGDGVELVIDGRRVDGPFREQARECTFDDTGIHYACAVKVSGQWFIIIDGKRNNIGEGEIVAGPNFEMDKNEVVLAYTLSKNKKFFHAVMPVAAKLDTEKTSMELTSSGLDRVGKEFSKDPKIDGTEENKQRAAIESAIEDVRQRVSKRERDHSSIMDIKMKIYYNLIWQRIRSVWALPKEALEGKKNLETIIAIRIAKDGQIESIRFEKKSGNPYLDESALRAIKKAHPLLPFPPEFKEDKLDVSIRFSPSDL